MPQIKKIIFLMLLLAISMAQAAADQDSREEAPVADIDTSHYTKLAAYNNDLIITVLLHPGLATHAVNVPKEQGVASLAFWMRAGLPPSSYAEVNPFAAESMSQQALKARILEADEELAPANVLHAALKVTGGLYPEAVQIAANVFKEAEGRARLAALAGTFPDEVQHEFFVSKLVDLRPSPSHGEDKLTPWVDYFSALFAGSVVGDSQLAAWLNTFPSGVGKEARMSIWQTSAMDTLRVLQPALRNAAQPKTVAGLVSEETEKSGFLEQLFSAFGGWLTRGDSAKASLPELPTECRGKGKLDVDVVESCQQGRLVWLNPIVSITGESRCGKQLRKVVFDPMRETEVPAGRYQIKVNAEGFGAIEDALDIQAGQTLKKAMQICAKPESSTEQKPHTPTPRVARSKAGVVVLAANQVELRTGESVPIPAWIVDEHGWNTGVSLAEIYTENTMVAQIGADATIKALEPGETRLRISLKGRKPQEIKVTVLSHSLVSCRIAPMVNLIRAGDVVQFLGQGILSNGTITTEMAMKWRSTDDATAIFLDNHSGRVQTRQPGNVEIQAEASRPNSRVTCSTTLKVEPVVLRQSMRAARMADSGGASANEKLQRQQFLPGRMAGGWQCLSSNSRGKSHERFITLAPSGTSYMLVLPGGIKTHGKMGEDNRYEFTFRSSSATVNLALKAGADGLVGEERLQLDDGVEQNSSIQCRRAEM